MLIRVSTLKQIKSGEVTLAFRRWKRPSINSGGTLRTAVGVLSIDGVEKTTLKSITEHDAKQAGYDGRGALLKELRGREGDLYKIAVSFAGADPRVKLRDAGVLSDADFETLVGRLKRFDSASRRGPWTAGVLELIRQHPGVSAGVLADKGDYEKAWLKANVRKLKDLGLTISQAVGYTLSPRGHSLLARIADEIRLPADR